MFPLTQVCHCPNFILCFCSWVQIIQFISHVAEFEKAEKKRLESEMEEYARQLEEETKRDKEKHEKNINSLNKRKEDLVKERKQKMQVSISGICK